jgi:RNA polymerase sigma factor (TIGR02999 family)
LSPRSLFSSPSPPSPLQSETDEESGHGRGIFLSGIPTVLPKSTEVTGLLKAWSGGDEAALERLTDHVYDELRRIARRYMRNERAGNTLQTTALVNEAYLRLVDVKGIEWQQRAQFFGLAAQLMRRILVDAARARGSQKRGGGAIKVNMDEAFVQSPERDASLVALDEALEVFSKLAERQAKVVELRYFGGLSEEETAEVLKISLRTVRRDLNFAKSWLTRELSDKPKVC